MVCVQTANGMEFFHLICLSQDPFLPKKTTQCSERGTKLILSTDEVAISPPRVSPLLGLKQCPFDSAAPRQCPFDSAAPRDLPNFRIVSKPTLGRIRNRNNSDFLVLQTQKRKGCLLRDAAASCEPQLMSREQLCSPHLSVFPRHSYSGLVSVSFKKH